MKSIAHIFTTTNAVDILTSALENLKRCNTLKVFTVYNDPFKSYAFFKLTVGSIYFDTII